MVRRSVSGRRAAAVLWLLLAAAPAASAAEAPAFSPAQSRPTLQEWAPKAMRESGKGNFLSLTVENDALGRGTDKNYTSGVRLSYFDIREKPGELVDRLDRLIPFFKVNETTGITYSLGQNLYTPDDIGQREQVADARPWAAFLYGSISMTTLTGDHVDDAEATLGVVGPWAQGEPAQKFVHNVLGYKDPEGWDEQIENEPGLILSWRRRWPQLYAVECRDFLFSAEPNVGASAGNVYTLAEGGVTLRLSPLFDRWQDTPLLVRPSIPGTGYFEPQKDKTSWYFFGGAQGRAVVRNIFLDGNTFEPGYSVDKKPLVMDLNVGIAMTVGDIRLSYTLVYRTKEYDGQKGKSLFGAAGLGYRF